MSQKAPTARPGPRRLSSPGIGPDERVRVTLALSLLFHGLILFGVTFTYEEPAASLPSLDVILVEQQTEASPDKPDFLANANQRGGGEHDKAQRPRQPTSGDLPKEVNGKAALELRAKHPRNNPRPNETVVSTSGPSEERVTTDPKQVAPNVPQISEQELIRQSLEMARLAAEIERQADLYAKRPKRKFISANTQEYAYAAYMRAWVARVERIGNLNFPPAARETQLAGDLVLTVAMRRNGSVERIDVVRSSGHSVLDDAAIRIVHLSEPFAPLPKTGEDIDILHVTRTWQFLPNGVLGTQ